jgi:translation initiation factor IF-2
MPSRSSKSPAPSEDEGTPSTPAKKATAKKALSLIEEGDTPAPKKRAAAPLKSASAFTPLGSQPAAKKAAKAVEKEPAPVEPARKTVEDEKKGALNLFEEQEKIKEAKAKRRQAAAEAPPAPPKATTSMLPPISRLKAELEPEPEPVAAGPVEPAPPPPPPPAPEPVASEDVDPEQKIIHLKPPVVVKDLAEKMGLKAFKVIADLIAYKVFVTADKVIELDIAEKICEKHGWKLEREKREKGAGVHKVEEVIVEPEPVKIEEQPVDEMQLRAPIITFMGHVDHGKTSLLDALRKSTVASHEAGGITQHVGAYTVFHEGKPITFIDTPGHAAFSAMRARGANVTDIVVLIIAADDGIMPQTKEALSHAKAAGVQLMVAINKCDLPAANLMKVKGQMQDIGIASVDWGGEIETMEVSAKTGQGLNDFLDTMSLQAEVLELKANPRAPARATVIESSMQEGRGPVATVIVRQGTLKVGQPFICGPYWGKTKALLDDRGKPIKAVLPGMPCELVGFSDMPHVGDEVVIMDSERAVKKLSEERLDERRKNKLVVARRSTLESLFANIAANEQKALKVIVKADVQGSVEAVNKCLKDLPQDKIRLDILHSDVGAITENDVLLASASDGIVIGFNQKVENKANAVARREGVQIKLYSIIYELVDQVKDAMQGLLDPITREKVIGHARVKQLFKVTKGWVAGCNVSDGRIDRKARARVLRDGQPVYDGSIDTLKHFKDDVGEVRSGRDCGMRLAGYSEYEEGDIIECYELEKIAQTL